MAKILPGENTQPCPILIRYRSPPRQRFARQQRDSHFDNLRGLCHSGYLAELLDIECPIRQLLSIAVKLLGFI